jgi:hypothetical protein
MLVLYRNCLPRDFSERDNLIVPIKLAVSVVRRLRRTGQPEPVDEVAEYLREARKLCQSEDFLRDCPFYWLLFLVTIIDAPKS